MHTTANDSLRRREVVMKERRGAAERRAAAPARRMKGVSLDAIAAGTSECVEGVSARRAGRVSGRGKTSSGEGQCRQ